MYAIRGRFIPVFRCSNQRTRKSPYSERIIFPTRDEGMRSDVKCDFQESDAHAECRLPIGKSRFITFTTLLRND